MGFGFETDAYEFQNGFAGTAPAEVARTLQGMAQIPLTMMVGCAAASATAIGFWTGCFGIRLGGTPASRAAAKPASSAARTVAPKIAAVGEAAASKVASAKPAGTKTIAAKPTASKPAATKTAAAKPATTQTAKPAVVETAVAATRPSGLEAPEGAADDLKMISGVGPKLEVVLNDLGIYHFHQIAAWTPAEVDWVDSYLRFKGRIGRDNWVVQAAALARGGAEEYQRVFGKAPR